MNSITIVIGILQLRNQKLKDRKMSCQKLTHQGSVITRKRGFNLRVYFKKLIWIHAIALLSSLGLYPYFI